ncbi:MAG: CD1247 N-terminal domain-containing protein [Bacillota bacterium]
MKELKEKTAYLRGLVEGADFPKDEKEKLIWEGLMDFCDEVAEEVSQLEESQNEVEDYVEAIDQDLGSLEKYFYNAEDEDEEAEVVFSKDGQEAVMEMTCPYCHEDIYFEDQNGNYEVICPECGKVVWNSSLEESNSNHKTDAI